MHALTSTAAAPRVWLVTRPIIQAAPARARRIHARPTYFHSLVAGILFGLASIALFSVVALARDMQLFVIDGDGLEPSIPSGSLIVVSPAADRLLAAGEIVTLPGSDGTLVPGYITEVSHGPDGIHYSGQVIGEATNTPRVNLTASMLGRVSLYIPGVANALELILGPVGRVIVVGLALGAVTFHLGPFIGSRSRAIRLDLRPTIARRYRAFQPIARFEWPNAVRRLRSRWTGPAGA
jgi:hypothetical protein